MSARLLIPLGAFVIWCFVCQRWYVCNIKQACPTDGTEVVVDEAEATPDNRPLVFNWDSPEAETRSSFEAYRDSLLAALPEGHILEIIGLYSEGEASPEGSPNMGFARANNIKALFADFLPEEQMLVSSRVEAAAEDAQSNPFVAAAFGSIEPTEEETVEIVEVADGVIIQFPFSKAVKEADPKVDEYLATLAERLKQTEETVSITGHTDDVGEADANLALGRARAKHVQDILLSKGIDAGRITIDSKGEGQPSADNGSEAGRRKNRRAELKLNKKVE